MADPISALTILKVGTGVAGVFASASQSMAAEAQADLQAKLAETQALQRDTLAREELLRSESAVRAARGANGLSAVSPNAGLLFSERRDQSDRDRLVARADDQQRAANYRLAASNERRKRSWSLATGLATSAIPLAQYGSYKGVLG